MMKKTLTVMIVLVWAVLLLSSAAFAEQRARPDEAKALLKKALAYYKTVGKEKAFEEFNKPDGKFTNLKKGLYVTAYDYNGKCHASGANKAMIGKDFLDLKDADGKFIIRAAIAQAKSKNPGWVNYRWTNPGTKKIEKKTTLVEAADEFYLLACGTYFE
jgi:cytochrome c